MPLTIMSLEELKSDERYLRLLSEKFPTRKAVVTELINLKAILSLPKGTEHIVSDLHGESGAFVHILKNASGVVRRKVDDIYGLTLSENEKRALCALIYYPEERIELVRKSLEDPPQPSLEGRELSIIAEGALSPSHVRRDEEGRNGVRYVWIVCPLQ